MTIEQSDSREVELTDDMIEAGVKALDACCDDDARADIVTRVVVASLGALYRQTTELPGTPEPESLI